MKIKAIVMIVIIMFMSACSTVTITPSSSNKIVSSPTYEERKSFYMWGLAGEHRVDVKRACIGAEVLQMQTQQTFVDGLLILITLGIYAPHTVKVWCK